MTTTLRIGLGWDRHRLESGRPCLLAGVELDCPVGPIAHSDGDVVLHAVTDALLGAAGLDDLGTLFSDQDPRWENAASSQFLQEAMRLLQEKDLAPASIDIVIVCDQPRIGPHRAVLREHLAKLLTLPFDRVNLKGKSTEGGDSNCIEVQAVALICGSISAL